MKNKIHILRVWTETQIDDSPDTSYIGDYTDTYSDWSICRHCGEYLHECADDHNMPEKSREYRFFVPYASGEKEGTDEYKRYGRQDYARMGALNDGEWYFLGIIAKAEIKMPSAVIQVIRSGGLWGVESDSGDYIEKVKIEQLSELRTELESLGLGNRAIDQAMRNVGHKDK